MTSALGMVRLTIFSDIGPDAFQISLYPRVLSLFFYWGCRACGFSYRDIIIDSVKYISILSKLIPDKSLDLCRCCYYGIIVVKHLKPIIDCVVSIYP